jgi:hypothetical protein
MKSTRILSGFILAATLYISGVASHFSVRVPLVPRRAAEDSPNAVRLISSKTTTFKKKNGYPEVVHSRGGSDASIQVVKTMTARRMETFR